MKNKNLRTMVITSSSGKDVKDTSQLKGEAKPAPGWTAKNETTEYSTSGGTGPGRLGGKNAGL